MLTENTNTLVARQHKPIPMGNSLKAPVYLWLVPLMLMSVPKKVISSETLSVWRGSIPCVGPSQVRSRFIEFTTDGGKAWLRGFTNSSETYESKLKKRKAKFKGDYWVNQHTFRKNIRVTATILKNGDVKISGVRGHRDSCSGTLKAAVVKDPEVIAKENAEKLTLKIKYLPGDWKGKGGALGKSRQDVVASFKQLGDKIIGSISFDPCLPTTKLTVVKENNILIISGSENTRSFNADIYPASDNVTETKIQVYYRLLSDINGCSENEWGTLSLERQ